MKKIDTLKFANDVMKEIRVDVDGLPFTPEYTCYLVSDENGVFNKASERYVSLKHQTSEECGVKCTIKRLSINEFAQEMLLVSMNKEPIRAMLQLPAPKQCVEMFESVVESGAIIDVDHLGDDVFADMWNGIFDRQPATPRGVVALITDIHGSLSGKKIAVIGSRSKTTGRFLVPMLQSLNATVSMYHSRSKITDNEFENYDIIISCVGSPEFIKPYHVGETPKTCIDVGVSVVDGKVKGDFSFDIRDYCVYTPWVNGVGLITRVFLVRNVVDSYILM